MMSIAASAAEAPEFEAVSVKVSPAGTPFGGMHGGPGTASPLQINYEAATLRAVVATAFEVQRAQIAGPPWFDDQRYDMVARLPPGTAMPAFRLMLQKMLSDRFGLQFHREGRTAVIYECTVAKSGLKMTKSPAAPEGRSFIEVVEGSKSSEVRVHRQSLRQLIVFLTTLSDRPIIDKTGLPGTWEFAMPWPLLHEDEPDEPGFTVNTAVDKFLGLKLTPKKEAVETLIIDRLERTPAPN